jgi:hypothetical protein
VTTESSWRRLAGSMRKAGLPWETREGSRNQPDRAGAAGDAVEADAASTSLRCLAASRMDVKAEAKIGGAGETLWPGRRDDHQ